MTRHLGLQVSAYVDRCLDAQTLHAFDRHLVACQVCRYAAQEESRLLESLRTGCTPAVSSDLRLTLLALAHPAPAEMRVPSTGGIAGPPPIPVPAIPVRHLRVPTVAPAAPAMHRSPRRAAMVAGLAAGASAAAAIGLAVVGPGTSAASPLRQPVTRIPVSTSLTALTASFSASPTSALTASSRDLLRDAVEHRGR